MNKIKSIFILGMSLWGVACFAQVRSFSIGYNLGGQQSLRYSYIDTDENYSYKYKPSLAVTVSYEDQLYGQLTAMEFGYANYAFDDYSLNYGNLGKNEGPSFDPDVTDDLTVYSFMGYMGTSLNSQNRLQFPVMFGLGLDYDSNALAHNLAMCIGAKGRAKFYVTDNIALFVGANWKGGYGARHYPGQTNSSGNQDSYNMFVMSLYMDAGLYFNF